MLGIFETLKRRRIVAAQEERTARRAMLIEVMAVPEEERSESENEWVHSYLEGRVWYRWARYLEENRNGGETNGSA